MVSLRLFCYMRGRGSDRHTEMVNHWWNFIAAHQAYHPLLSVDTNTGFPKACINILIYVVFEWMRFFFPVCIFCVSTHIYQFLYRSGLYLYSGKTDILPCFLHNYFFFHFQSVLVARNIMVLFQQRELAEHWDHA